MGGMDFGLKQPEGKKALYCFLISIIAVAISHSVIIKQLGISGMLFTLFFILWLCGSILFAQAKGYNAAWGLIGLLGIGIIILLLLPNKNYGPVTPGIGRQRLNDGKREEMAKKEGNGGGI